MAEKIAIIRIRGTEGVKTEILDTMKMLKMHHNHVCSVYDKTPTIMGMVEKCKDYCTYGEIDEETFKLLLEKRAIKDKKGKVQNYFLLNSPKGGFEKNGLKHSFKDKGALGNRGAAINALIKKMM